MSTWHEICLESDLQEGQRKIIDIDNNHIMILRHQGEIHALESMCSHAMFELDDGDINDCALSCPLHGAHFCIKTGEPLKGPAYEPIAIYPVKIENGMLYIQQD